MVDKGGPSGLELLKKTYPDKFAAEKQVFSKIHAGNRIFIGTAVPNHSIWLTLSSTMSSQIPRRFSTPRSFKSGH
jgi:hypothetical protein